MRPSLRFNLAIPKLWAICQETSTQSKRPRGLQESRCVCKPQAGPRLYLSLVATRGHPKPAHLQACGQGKRGGEESVFTNLIYQSFKKKKNLYWIICSDAPRLGNRDTVRSLTSVS